MSTPSDSQAPNWAKAASTWSDHIPSQPVEPAHWEPFIFPRVQGNLTCSFHILMAFLSVWNVFPTPPYYFFPAPPPIHPANVLRSVSEVVSSGSLHQPTKMNHFPLGATHSSVLISTALTNHLGKRTVPFPRGLPLHPQVYEVPLWCGPVLLVLASQHPDWSEFNRVAE